MDNTSAHCNPRIVELIQSHKCQVRFLPPYSPHFNPIEMTFSVLKAWVRRHFHETWPHFEGTFGEYLRYAVGWSQCDRFPREHFGHSGLYILDRDIREFERELELGRVAFEV